MLLGGMLLAFLALVDYHTRNLLVDLRLEVPLDTVSRRLPYSGITWYDSFEIRRGRSEPNRTPQEKGGAFVWNQTCLLFSPRRDNAKTTTISYHTSYLVVPLW